MRQRIEPTDIVIDTPKYRAAVAVAGYTTGVRAGSFLDKATGARDLGFGLSVVDFLLEPADPGAPIVRGQYDFGPDNPVHGNIAKRYVEGPQICTQAKRLDAKVIRGERFTAVKLRYDWNAAYAPREKGGSKWEQTLIFPEGERYFLSADRVTTVTESPELFFRVDMPGHIKHMRGNEFEHIYLSYQKPDVIPSTEFTMDFPPDRRFLYRRGEGARPERFIRAYQVNLPGKDAGPWLAGMTLNVDDVYQAWCHQRGYVCLIEELGGRATKAGDTFGAAYVVGWFDDIGAMNAAYDRHRGFSGWELEGPEERPTGWRGVKGGELKAVGG